MTYGFTCQSCDGFSKGKPLLEIEVSASIGKLNGDGRNVETKTMHYCERCVASHMYARYEWQPQIEFLVDAAVAGSGWRWKPSDA